MTNLAWLFKAHSALAASAVNSTNVGVNLNEFDAILNASPVVQVGFFIAGVLGDWFHKVPRVSRFVSRQ